MKKETIESIIKWSITPILLVILIIVVHNSKEKNQIEQKEMEERYESKKQEEYTSRLSDKYIYMDMNKVYHTTMKCIDDLRFRKDFMLYSLQYIEKDSIHNWFEFARTHQLCTQCFPLQMVNDLGSGANVFVPWSQQFRETDDELYRDADEEFYNRSRHCVANGYNN